MDDATKEATRLGIEFITACAASAETGDDTLMRDTVVRILSAPNAYTEAMPAVTSPESLRHANAIHLLYAVSNVTKRALDKLSECRGGTPVLTLLQEISRDLLED